MAVVEVVPPLQEAGDVVLEQLAAQHPVAAGGHGDKAVGHIPVLAAAVVGPQLGHLVRQEGLDVVAGRDGMIHQALGVKIVVAQRVHDLAARQQPHDPLAGGAVAVQVLQAGLVGDVEVAVSYTHLDVYKRQGC